MAQVMLTLMTLTFKVMVRNLLLMGVFINPASLRFQELTQKGGRKNVRGRG